MVRLEDQRARIPWLQGERLVHGDDGRGAVVETAAGVSQPHIAEGVALTGCNDPLERVSRLAPVADPQGFHP